MPKTKLTNILWYALFLVWLGIPSHAQDTRLSGSPVTNPPQAEYHSDKIMIRFHHQLSQPDWARFEKEVGQPVTSMSEARRLFHQKYKTTVKSRLLYNWQSAEITPGKSLDACLHSVRASALVSAAERLPICRLDALSNSYTALANITDPFYQDAQTVSHNQWWLNRTRADAAAAQIALGTHDTVIVVAVIDTGADLDHNDLAGRFVTGYNALSVEDAPLDDHGHGTHVAGLIAATHNQTGIAGTAWDNRVQIMPIKALNAAGEGDILAIVDGIDYAIRNNARVINMSFGGYGDEPEVLRLALAEAAKQNIVLVAAAGNAGVNLVEYPVFPATDENVLTIAATHAMDQYAYYSNWSSPAGLISCAAPGGDFYQNDYGILSTVPEALFLTEYKAFQGTSMAAPQVSALAALLLVQNPERTPAIVKSLILDGCELNGYSETDLGAGRINVLTSLVEGSPLPLRSPLSPETTPTATTTPTPIPTASPASRADSAFIAFPNPGREIVCFHWPDNTAKRVSIIIFNMAGEKISDLHADFPESLCWYTKQTAPGIYLYQVVVDYPDRRETLPPRKLAILK